MIFFKALIDNQLLYSALKGFVSVFTEMYFDGIMVFPNLRLKLRAVARFGFLPYSLRLCNKIESIDFSIRSEAVLLIQL